MQSSRQGQDLLHIPARHGNAVMGSLLSKAGASITPRTPRGSCSHVFHLHPPATSGICCSELLRAGPRLLVPCLGTPMPFPRCWQAPLSRKAAQPSLEWPAGAEEAPSTRASRAGICIKGYSSQAHSPQLESPRLRESPSRCHGAPGSLWGQAGPVQQVTRQGSWSLVCAK